MILVSNFVQRWKINWICLDLKRIFFCKFWIIKIIFSLLCHQKLQIHFNVQTFLNPFYFPTSWHLHGSLTQTHEVAARLLDCWTPVWLLELSPPACWTLDCSLELPGAPNAIPREKINQNFSSNMKQIQTNQKQAQQGHKNNLHRSIFNHKLLRHSTVFCYLKLSWFSRLTTNNMKN